MPRSTEWKTLSACSNYEHHLHRQFELRQKHEEDRVKASSIFEHIRSRCILKPFKKRCLARRRCEDRKILLAEMKTQRATYLSILAREAKVEAAEKTLQSQPPNLVRKNKMKKSASVVITKEKEKKTKKESQQAQEEEDEEGEEEEEKLEDLQEAVAAEQEKQRSLKHELEKLNGQKHQCFLQLKFLLKPRGSTGIFDGLSPQCSPTVTGAKIINVSTPSSSSTL